MSTLPSSSHSSTTSTRITAATKLLRTLFTYSAESCAGSEYVSGFPNCYKCIKTVQNRLYKLYSSTSLLHCASRYHALDLLKSTDSVGSSRLSQGTGGDTVEMEDLGGMAFKRTYVRVLCMASIHYDNHRGFDRRRVHRNIHGLILTVG
jgi:hypothetical protein